MVVAHASLAKQGQAAVGEDAEGHPWASTVSAVSGAKPVASRAERAHIIVEGNGSQSSPQHSGPQLSSSTRHMSQSGSAASLDLLQGGQLSRPIQAGCAGLGSSIAGSRPAGRMHPEMGGDTEPADHTSLPVPGPEPSSRDLALERPRQVQCAPSCWLHWKKENGNYYRVQRESWGGIFIISV